MGTLNLTFSFRLLLNQRIFQYFKQFNISIIITMSSQNDPLAAAKQAERDLNSNAAKQGYSKGDSATDSGIDDRATKKFPGASVRLSSNLPIFESSNLPIFQYSLLPSSLPPFFPISDQ